MLHATTGLDNILSLYSLTYYFNQYFLCYSLLLTIVEQINTMRNFVTISGFWKLSLEYNVSDDEKLTEKSMCYSLLK